MKNLTSISISFLFISCFSLQAQDPQFSQFYSNPVYLNPALVGTANQYRASLIHRQQGEAAFGYTTSAFSFDGSIGSGSSGWGVQVISDNQSDLIHTTSYSMSLSHRIDISKNSQFGLGVRVGAYKKALNLNKLTFEDQLDGRNGVVNSTNEEMEQDLIQNADVAVGLLYMSDNFFAGVNINHLNNPSENNLNNTDAKLAKRYTLHAGGFLYSKNYRRADYVLSPNVIYERQGTSSYVNLGMYFSTEIWTVGAWYRWDDAVIASLGANLGKIKLGYSHDLPVKKYDSMNGNAHELSLNYTFELPKKFKLKNRYKGQCPKFYQYLY